MNVNDMTALRTLTKLGGPTNQIVGDWRVFSYEPAAEFSAEELGLTAFEFFLLVDSEYNVLVAYKLDDDSESVVDAAVYVEGLVWGELAYPAPALLQHRIAAWYENGRPMYRINPSIGSNK